jgi:hypothetical protein
MSMYEVFSGYALRAVSFRRLQIAQGGSAWLAAIASKPGLK